MKTKLLKKIREKYVILWIPTKRQWCIYDHIHTAPLYSHFNLGWIMMRAVEGVYNPSRCEKIMKKYFSRTLCRTSRVIHRNKVLKRSKKYKQLFFSPFRG